MSTFAKHQKRKHPVSFFIWAKQESFSLSSSLIPCLVRFTGQFIYSQGKILYKEKFQCSHLR